MCQICDLELHSSLYWQPVELTPNRSDVVSTPCVDEQTSRCVHQSLVGAAPAKLSDDCRLLSDVGRRPLRSNSNDMLKLLVPRTHNKLGDRSFSAAGPRLWNNLPPGLRATAAGTYLRLFQAISENLFIWRPKRLVTLLNL